MKKNLFALLSVLVLTSLFLFACGAAATPAAEPAQAPAAAEQAQAPAAAEPAEAPAAAKPMKIAFFV